MSDLIINELVTDTQLVKRILLDQFKITFISNDRFISPKDTSITEINELEATLLNYLKLAGQVNTRKSKDYWEMIISKLLNLLQIEREAQLAAKLAYDPVLAERAPLVKLVKALTDKEEQVDIEAMSQFLWQVKRKILNLPVTYHLMPILWGKQKSGKSETIKKLLTPIENYVYNGSTFAMLGDDRYYRAFTLNFVFFFDEMRKVERADIQSVKGMITAPHLTYRILGKNDYATKPNRATLIGASNLNPSQLLMDSTGMRRYWYMKCQDRIDWDSVNEINMLDVWKCIDERRERAYTLDVADEMERVQEQLRPKDALETMIEEGVITPDRNNEEKLVDVYELFKSNLQNQGVKNIINRRSFEAQLVDNFGIEVYTKVVSATQKLKMVRVRLAKKGAISTKGLQ